MQIRPELWQVFTEEGESVAGVGKEPKEFLDGPVSGAAHVWLWRHSKNGGVEVLLQERSKEHPSWPGYLDISAAGQINFGEKPIEAAIREANEELGINIESDNLELIFFYHKSFQPDVKELTGRLNQVQWIYLCEVTSDLKFSFDDGEVSGLRWIDYEKFKEGSSKDGTLHVVRHGADYFGKLYAGLEAKK